MILLFIARRLSAYFTVVHMALLYGLFVPDEGISVATRTFTVGMGAVHWVVMSKGALLMIIPHFQLSHASTPALQVFSPLSRVWPAVAGNREVKKEWPAVTYQATIAYYLLMDNRFRATSDYLGAKFQESMCYRFSLAFTTGCVVFLFEPASAFFNVETEPPVRKAWFTAFGSRRSWDLGLRLCRTTGSQSCVIGPADLIGIVKVIGKKW
ncbi:hypothetical protein IFM89_015081 [Coptis chinensis]|uniref:Uncharacterized protein n=1 Tax=Coptis chinensis TaxID=261450 RepID=A0A835ICY0_9MAGN|nr:hypothetical protein IFM89_015081 [Coptis chinensis]